MRTEPAAGSAEDRVTVACLRAADLTLAIDVAAIREVVRFRPPTPLPGAPPLIEGVLDLRGALVPIVDLAQVLGRTLPEQAPARIAVVEVDGMLLGLAAQQVLSVAAVPASALSDPPPLAAELSQALVSRLIRREQAAPIPLLSLPGLLARIHRAGLEEEAA